MFLFVFFLSIYGLQQHRKGGKAHERLLSSLSSPPASALIDAGIKYALTSADDHPHCHLSLRLSWISWIFWKQFVKFLIWRFAKNIFGSPGQKIFINSLNHIWVHSSQFIFPLYVIGLKTWMCHSFCVIHISYAVALGTWWKSQAVAKPETQICLNWILIKFKKMNVTNKTKPYLWLL